MNTISEQKTTTATPHSAEVTDDGSTVVLTLAGSPPLLVSPPTMVVAFFGYCRDEGFEVLCAHSRVAMPAGSV